MMWGREREVKDRKSELRDGPKTRIESVGTKG